DDTDPPARVQKADCILQRFFRRSQLVIDGDPDSLENPLCGMSALSPGSGGNTGFDQLHKFESRPYRTFLPCLLDLPRDLFGEFLFAITVEDADQIPVCPVINYFIGAERSVLVHPHIERRIIAVAESPLRSVELRRRNAQIIEHSIHACNAKPAELFLQVTEVRSDENDLVQVVGEAFPGVPDGCFVLVEADEPALLTKLL